MQKVKLNTFKPNVMDQFYTIQELSEILNISKYDINKMLLENNIMEWIDKKLKPTKEYKSYFKNSTVLNPTTQRYYFKEYLLCSQIKNFLELIK